MHSLNGTKSFNFLCRAYVPEWLVLCICLIILLTDKLNTKTWNEVETQHIGFTVQMYSDELTVIVY